LPHTLLYTAADKDSKKIDGKYVVLYGYTSILVVRVRARQARGQRVEKVSPCPPRDVGVQRNSQAARGYLRYQKLEEQVSSINKG
jgi:hypothetical protein